jgi:hypothetical protein
MYINSQLENFPVIKIRKAFVLKLISGDIEVGLNLSLPGAS